MLRRRTLLAALVVLGVAVAAVAVRAQLPATHVDERDVHLIASDLRCVVCQNLSVADSPSEMASQMRGVIRERLAAGERPDEIRRYFVDRYGEWILLEPRREGFTLLVWVLPPLATLAGLGVLAVVLVRWTRRSRRAPLPVAPVDPAMSERIRREMEREA